MHNNFSLKTAIIVISPILILYFSAVNFWPIKFAVMNPENKKYECMILVRREYSTMALWSLIGDENGEYEEPIDVFLTGNYPSGFNYDVDTGENTYVCYGTYLGKKITGQYEIEAYNIEHWEILYPVKRNSPIQWFLPKSFLCKFDYN